MPSGALTAETIVTAEFEPQDDSELTKLTRAESIDEPPQRQRKRAWPRVLAQIDERVAK